LCKIGIDAPVAGTGREGQHLISASPKPGDGSPPQKHLLSYVWGFHLTTSISIRQPSPSLEMDHFLRSIC